MIATNQVPPPLSGRPNPPATTAPPVPAEGAAAGGPTAFADPDGPSFWDLLDIINPLQHIPIVNTIYREITGDEIGAVARVVGGGLFGGPIGVVAAMANLAIEEGTGKDVGEHVLAAFLGGEGGGDDHQAPATVAEPGSILPGPIQAPPSAAAPPAQTQAAVGEGALAEALSAPLPETRFMPLPPRGSLAPVRFMAAPPRPPAPVPMADGPDPTSIRRAARAQGLDSLDHPLLQRAAPDGAAAATAPAAVPPAEPPAPAGEGLAEQPGDWFSTRFLDAMDKYERSRNLTPRRDDEL